MGDHAVVVPSDTHALAGRVADHNTGRFSQAQPYMRAEGKPQPHMRAEGRSAALGRLGGQRTHPGHDNSTHARLTETLEFSAGHSARWVRGPRKCSFLNAGRV